MARSVAGKPRSTQQPRWLILDFFAAFVRRLDDHIAIAHLVELMGDVSLDEQTVRSSVSRLKRRGWLIPDRVDGLAGYRISEHALRDLAEGDARVFRTEPARLEDGWCVVFFSIPAQMAKSRHVLRSKLTWWGFGNPAPGVWIAPHRSHGYAERTIGELGLERYSAVFGGSYLGVGEIDGFIRRAWNFDRLSSRYRGFVDQHAEVAARWSDGRRKLSGRDAFVDYLTTLNAWRSIPFLDPGLPTELLPEDWRGEEAIDLFQSIERTLNERAFGYVLQVIEGRLPAPTAPGSAE
jgi:phenylacetic acid degradation operon negative regulatory protein